MFLPHPLEEVQIRVLELTQGKRVVVNTYPHNEDAQTVIYMIASEGHMRWAKPSPVTRPRIWKEWAQEVAEIVYHPRVDIGVEEEDWMAHHGQRTLYPCKHCQQKVKTTLTRLTTGNSKGLDMERSDQLVGAAKETTDTPQLPASNTASGTSNPQQAAVGESPVPSVLREDKLDGDYEPVLEELGNNWRRAIATLTEATDYLGAAHQPYDESRVEHVADMGSRLVRAAGDL